MTTAMTIPFLDLQAAYLELKDELDAAYQRVMASGWYILGPEVEAFENDFAAYCEAAHGIGVASGLDAGARNDAASQACRRQCNK